MHTYLSNDDEEAHRQWMELEKYIADVAGENEKQGFIYGFRYAIDLFTNTGKLYSGNRLEENIRSEYSTLAVESIDKTDKVVDILKEYLPKEKFTDTVDILCTCLNDTKYAVFEQGFLRG